MTATLRTLIQLSSSHVDEHRRALADFARQHQQVQDSIANIDRSLADEANFVNRNPESGFTFPAFHSASMQQRMAHQDRLATLERRMARVRTRLLEAWQMAERYRYLLKLAEQRVIDEAKRLEQIELDELGMMAAHAENPARPPRS